MAQTIFTMLSEAFRQNTSLLDDSSLPDKNASNLVLLLQKIDETIINNGTNDEAILNYILGFDIKPSQLNRFLTVRKNTLLKLKINGYSAAQIEQTFAQKWVDYNDVFLRVVNNTGASTNKPLIKNFNDFVEFEYGDYMKQITDQIYKIMSFRDEVLKYNYTSTNGSKQNSIYDLLGSGDLITINYFFNLIQYANKELIFDLMDIFNITYAIDNYLDIANDPVQIARNKNTDANFKLLPYVNILTIEIKKDGYIRQTLLQLINEYDNNGTNVIKVYKVDNRGVQHNNVSLREDILNPK